MSESAAMGALVPGQKCPLSGYAATVTREEWVESETARCHYCGGTTRIRVRATDMPGWARLLTHKVPRVTSPGSQRS